MRSPTDQKSGGSFCEMMGDPAWRTKTTPNKARLLSHSPGRVLRPRLQGIGSPRRRLVGVTRIAGIRDLLGFTRRGTHKLESVAPHVHVSDRLGDHWHVARDAFAAGAVG